MADMHLREKMKNVSEAAKNSDFVPERSKKAGVIVFILLIGCGIIVMLALAISLILNKHVIFAAVISIIAAFLSYSIYKIIKADDIGQL
jgi:hypothetical protein